MEPGESVKQALEREVREEAGCKIEIIEELGKIIEYKNELNKKQTSYCYLAKIKGRKEEPLFTKREKGRDFRLLWSSIDNAIKLMEKSNPKNYSTKFIKLRDAAFLREAKERLK